MPRSQYAGLELNSKLTLSKQWGPSPPSSSLKIAMIVLFFTFSLKQYSSDPERKNYGHHFCVIKAF